MVTVVCVDGWDIVCFGAFVEDISCLLDCFGVCLCLAGELMFYLWDFVSVFGYGVSGFICGYMVVGVGAGMEMLGGFVVLRILVIGVHGEIGVGLWICGGCVWLLVSLGLVVVGFGEGVGIVVGRLVGCGVFLGCLGYAGLVLLWVGVALDCCLCTLGGWFSSFRCEVVLVCEYVLVLAFSWGVVRMGGRGLLVEYIEVGLIVFDSLVVWYCYVRGSGDVGVDCGAGCCLSIDIGLFVLGCVWGGVLFALVGLCGCCVMGSDLLVFVRVGGIGRSLRVACSGFGWVGGYFVCGCCASRGVVRYCRGGVSRVWICGWMCVVVGGRLGWVIGGDGGVRSVVVVGTHGGGDVFCWVLCRAGWRHAVGGRGVVVLGGGSGRGVV
ncbi:hypothetical protein Tco_0839949 [Tanacetum coccineum]|uniref:Uncharacterized protein n=1 Tax=Tanacetum coccineum TaxID=301880 RepID=A0ABQ5AV70_9ASTR